MRGRRGFTLIELLVVLAIIATILSIVGPRYFGSLEKARDTVLQTNLKVMRDAIDRFRGDTGHYPVSLAELVERRYLRERPVDPVTERDDTWVEVKSGCNTQAVSTDCRGLKDVRSGAPGAGRNGLEYAKW